MNDIAQVRADEAMQNTRDLVVQVVGWLLVAIAAVELFAPLIQPALLAVIGLAPWALLLMVFLGNGKYLLYGPKGHTVIIGAVVLPIVLGLGTILQCHTIDWRGVAGYTVGIAVGFTLLSVMADASAVAARPDVLRSDRRGGWPAMVFAGALLGWSMLNQINASVSGPPDAQSVTIARKWVSGGKSHTPYFVFTDPPALGITDFAVPMGLFRQSAPGDRVCLVIHTGVLGWRWYDVGDRQGCNDPVWGKRPG